MQNIVRKTNHISLLLVSFFWNFVPELVKKGYLYVSMPPLYRITVDKKYHYVLNDAELEKFKSTHSGKNMVVSRFKGLGEMDANDLVPTMLDAESRVLQQMIINNDEEMSKIIDDLMGASAEPRKKFFEENSAKVEVFI